MHELRRRLQGLLFVMVIAENLMLLGVYAALREYTALSNPAVLALTVASGLLLAFFLISGFSKMVLQPLNAIRQAIMHLNPTEQGTAAPKISDLRFGRELVASLAAQVYQLGSVADKAAAEAQNQVSDLHRNFVAQHLPLPLFLLDSDQVITFANEAAAQYIGIDSKDMIGKNVYMVLDMYFPNNETFDSWLKVMQEKSATATASWERVHLNIRDGHPARFFDLAAYYNRENTDNHETILVMFDHTEQYSQDDQAVSFIALSVHELRTPLTLLRGYIEVFEEELADTDKTELKDFVQKMRAMSEQLTAFVNNILNVARVDSDQLELNLQSENWGDILKSAVELISLRAKVRGIRLECRISMDLPPVGIDPLSIREVINNLIDNAIKYSGNSKTIKIYTYLNKDGMVETTIQDFGVGIPASVLPNLFTKFYRDQRNRAQIGGTGLGLYLSKAIVAAHSGSLWVRSKEGQGSTFGFTLQPFDRLAETQKQGGDHEILRSAQGWIKNHSLYRR